MNQQDDPAIVRQIKRFYDHLARCIYVEVAQMRPADFAEVRQMVDSMRRSHYLDGPNDVDWIFRNQLLANREGRLYVDYIHEEEGDRWVSPAMNDEVNLGVPSPGVRELVGALHRLGCTSRRGLAIIAEAWKRETIDDSTLWPEIARVNRSIVAELLDGGIAVTTATQADASRVVDQWTFPIGSLNLSPIGVPLSELDAERARVVKRLPHTSD
jgi:hypothetical protein